MDSTATVCRTPGLTAGEVRIVELVSTGLRNRDIAALLGVSAKAVEYHLSNIFDKVGVRSRVQLATWYVREAQSSYR